jgi:hypothetical protein
MGELTIALDHIIPDYMLSDTRRHNMTNDKIERVKTAIENTSAKILTYQAKLRNLEREKTRLENEQIIALVRSEMISDADLSALMQSLRKDCANAASDIPPEVTMEKEITTRQEEKRNATLDEN